MSYAVRLCDLSHVHPGAQMQALSNINLSVEKGEILALIGPSGAGKSTLLALLGGQLTGWQGQASILGDALSPQHPPARNMRIKTGFIFQEFALIERATVRQNVLNGRLGRAGRLASLFGRFSVADLAAVEAALMDAGIADLADQRVDRISGGQRQRVAIARCLAQEPQLILADEPVSNLDPARAEAILALISGPARRATVIFTSHQPELALRFATRVVGLKKGKIVFDAAPEALGSAQIEALYRGDPAAQDLRQVG